MFVVTSCCHSFGFSLLKNHELPNEERKPSKTHRKQGIVWLVCSHEPRWLSKSDPNWPQLPYRLAGESLKTLEQRVRALVDQGEPQLLLDGQPLDLKKTMKLGEVGEWNHSSF